MHELGEVGSSAPLSATDSQLVEPVRAMNTSNGLESGISSLLLAPRVEINAESTHSPKVLDDSNAISGDSDSDTGDDGLPRPPQLTERRRMQHAVFSSW